jgi:ABC-type lipoprotein release transport system permease subunit
MVADLTVEAAASVAARPGRALLTTAGILLGVASLLAVLGISAAASAAITTQLDRIAVTTVAVSVNTASDPDPLATAESAADNAKRLDGVEEVGYAIPLLGIDQKVVLDPNSEAARDVQVFAVSDGYLPAAVYDPYDHAPAPPLPPVFEGSQAVIGHRIADERGRALSVGDHVFVAGRALLVAGRTDPAHADPRSGESVYVPLDAAAAFGWLSAATDRIELLVRTAPGEAQRLAPAIKQAANPRQPTLAGVTVAADPRSLRVAVTRDTQVLAFALGALLALAGIFSIANVMLTRVLERRAEIGLRRALGASRREILYLIVLEGALLGCGGAVLGAGLGSAVASVVALAQGWPSPAFGPATVWAVLAGSAAGAVASAYPAQRAIKIEPADSLRGL